MMFKKLGLKTIEGLSLENMVAKSSSKYEKRRGYSVDVVLNGKRLVTVKDYGDGDPVAIFYHTSSKEETDLIDKTVLQFLKRADEAYGPNGRHERLRNLEETTSREYVSLLNNLVREREIMQTIKKQFKNGVQMAAV